MSFIKKGVSIIPVEEFSKVMDIISQQESTNISEFDTKHMPTLGKSYENLAKKIIDDNFLALTGLKLYISAGFIRCGSRRLPNQIDLVISLSPGVNVPCTDDYEYEASSVVAFFEIKKRITKKTLIEALDHVKNIREAIASKSKMVSEKKFLKQRKSSIKNLSKHEALNIYDRVLDVRLPLSIVWGFEGHKTESGFQRSYCDSLCEIKYEDNNLIVGLPSIVISGDFTAVKFSNPYELIDYDGVTPIGSEPGLKYETMMQCLIKKIMQMRNIPVVTLGNLNTRNFTPFLKIGRSLESDFICRYYPYTEKELHERGYIFDPDFNRTVQKDVVSMLFICASSGGNIPISNITDGKGLAETRRLIQLIDECPALTIQAGQVKLIDNKVFINIQPGIQPWITNIESVREQTPNCVIMKLEEGVLIRYTGNAFKTLLNNSLKLVPAKAIQI